MEKVAIYAHVKGQQALLPTISIEQSIRKLIEYDKGYGLKDLDRIVAMFKRMDKKVAEA